MSYVDQKINEYSQLKSIPAFVSLAFVAASLYQFGAITTLQFGWGLDVAFDPAWSLPVSGAAALIALASSETRSFEYYSDVEIGTMVSGALVVLGYNLTPPQWFIDNAGAFGQSIADVLLGIGDPIASMLAFGTATTAWVVLVR